MLPALALAVGLVWFFADQTKRSKPVDPEPEPEPEPERPPVDGDADRDGIVEFDELTVWSGEGSVDDSVVWSYQTGIRREDGSEEFDTPYIVIGNGSHTSFLRASASGGTINIPKERSGGDQNMNNVRVFSSVEAALEYLNREEEPRDPSDPVQPQPEPEEDDSSGGGLPVQPDYGLGGGGSSLFKNGGI